MNALMFALEMSQRLGTGDRRVGAAMAKPRKAAVMKAIPNMMLGRKNKSNEVGKGRKVRKRTKE
jgi:hypothetical protein